MESVIRDHITKYMTQKCFFSNAKFGFIEDRNLLLQLLKVVDEWTKILDDHGQVDVIYTDLEKAFAKVLHRRLLSKLCSYGINNSVINWITSFLCGRTQVVRINKACSPPVRVLSGIPQGTVLGPLLFVIFVNDLPEVCENLSQIFLFADDAKICIGIYSVNDCLSLNAAGQCIHEWCSNWLMTLNCKKCASLSICRNTNNAIKKILAILPNIITTF